MPSESEIYGPHLDYHFLTGRHRLSTLSRFDSHVPDTLTPSIEFQRKCELGPLLGHPQEHSALLLRGKVPFVSLIKHGERKQQLKVASGVPERDLAPLAVWLHSRNEPQGGIFKLITYKAFQSGEPFLFHDTDVLVRRNLALTHITPQALRRLLAEFAPYIAMVAYFESWVEAYLVQVEVGTIFQRFISEVNQFLLGVRALVTALEIQLDKGERLTLMELQRKCRLPFDTLGRIHLVFLGLHIGGVAHLLCERWNAAMTGLLLERLYNCLDECWRVGDDHGYQVYLKLFAPCFELYLQFVSSWIRFGAFQDPKKEFMIEEQNGGFEIRKNAAALDKPLLTVPEFMKPFSTQIFDTGILFRELQSSAGFKSRTRSRSMQPPPSPIFFVPFMPLPKRSKSPTFFLYDSPQYSIPEHNFQLPAFPDLPNMPPPRPLAKCAVAGSERGSLEQVASAHLPRNTSTTPEAYPGSTHLFRGRSRFGLNNTLPPLISFGQTFLQQLSDFIQERHVEYNLELLRHLREKEGLMSYLLSLQAVFLFQHVPHLHIFTKELHRFRPREPIVQYHIDALLSRALRLQPLQIPAPPESGLDPSRIPNYALRVGCFSLVLSEDPLWPVRVNFVLAWPLDFVVDPATLPTYQRAFRMLHGLQRALYALEETGHWRTDASRSTSTLWIAARLHLLYIVNTIYSYFMTTVSRLPPLIPQILHSRVAAFNREAETIETVHGLRARHTAFVEDIRQQCFLGENGRACFEAVFDIVAIVDELRASDVASLKGDILARVFYLRNFLATTLSYLGRSATFSQGKLRFRPITLAIVKALAFSLEG
ncbi:hypothetical protein L0F63_006089 [Massospora cicadina]|nr:hypothetical protein L0F63_006089 [Massospora cicadina]